jgi:hypothetical protein
MNDVYELGGTYMLDEQGRPFKYRRWWQLWKPKRIYPKSIKETE